ncbi:hypothetical protein ABFS82_04G222700 [Erythranthe guttata]|uniref:protein YLS3-like isoform X2 n=1 Tax=Erythranthe guttata TaxID=4155 RepID=UPI00064D81B2|nr:PREDICTED: protein YLS3-like isoform X2 [Erythranthe guttata]|eukprot:XP_012835197.1 PREDICTED: protein YLS3-like isoform X2 [Erythranthe guttata]
MECSKVVPCILAVVMLWGSLATCDVDKDKEKCANDLVGLATCLPYVSGEAKAPPVDCCTGLKQILQKSPQCICLLVKDRNDPTLGLQINATLALGLPSQCHAPANISACPALLHLPPNSPDAKVFEDFVNSANKSNATSTSIAPVPGGMPTTTVTTAANQKSGDGGNKNKFLNIEMILGLIFTIMVVLDKIPNL